MLETAFPCFLYSRPAGPFPESMLGLAAAAAVTECIHGVGVMRIMGPAVPTPRFHR
jgi:hypothetical protein